MNNYKPLKRLTKKRNLLNMTQEQLAKKAKVSRPLLSNIERGAASPSLMSAYRIAKALNSTIDEIFFGTNVHKMNNIDKEAS